MAILHQQYESVKGMREVLFTFCQSISWDDYIRPVPNFGQGSIRKTQSHIADTYIHWIGKFALKKTIPYLQHDKTNSIESMKEEFKKINLMMVDFLELYDLLENSSISNSLGNHGVVTSTPLTLTTHVITHEFHHKGQMVSMARILGYRPPDTDLIRL